MRRLMRPRYIMQSITLGWLVALQPIWVSNSGAVCAGVAFGIGTWFFLVSVDQTRRERRRTKSRAARERSKKAAVREQTEVYIPMRRRIENMDRQARQVFAFQDRDGKIYRKEGNGTWKEE